MSESRPPNDKQPHWPITFSLMGVIAIWSGIALVSVEHPLMASLFDDSAPPYAVDGATFP